jgi:hypothetical protein
VLCMCLTLLPVVALTTMATVTQQGAFRSVMY